LAQLVKLQDYVSRYEKNLYHYQSLFMRIKESRWKAYKQNKENRDHKKISDEFRKILFSHQLIWASSTVKEISNLDQGYYQDRTLQFLTCDIPDNYFLFYGPVLQLKNAPVELDSILVGPADIWLIIWLSGEGIWQESQENKRFWKNVRTEHEESCLNPMIRLERMSRLIKECRENYQQRLTIRQSIVAPQAYIDFTSDWNKITYIDKRNFKDWHAQIRHNPAPIKNQQLRFVADLLSFGVTNSLSRKNPLSNESDLA
jgi:hypothetical protein